MAQTTVLAAGDTAADSTDITVNSGSNVTISLFCSVNIPLSTSLDIYLKTPGGTVTQVGDLNASTPTVSIYSPGVYYVSRPATSNPGVNVGVSVDS
jgi:hypothetical protein